MSDQKSRKKYSRRTFIKDLTSGVIGASVAVSTVRNVHAGPLDQEDTNMMSGGKEQLTFVLNGKPVTAYVTPETTLVDVLRNTFNLTGTKVVCNHGECGGCTVVVDNQAFYSCQMLALDVRNKNVLTIEGLLSGEELHPLQQAFIDKDGLQCGFCTPGQIMAAYALLLEHPNPDRETVIQGMSGNLCRCGAYHKIVDAVLDAAKKMKG